LQFAIDLLEQHCFRWSDNNVTKSTGPYSCPVARTARIIGDEWVVLVLRDLFRGPQRFDDLQKRTGAATNILTNRLKRLMDAELVAKKLYQERPPRYVYHLTRGGLALFPVLLELMRFGEDWLPSDMPAPSQLRHKDCGSFTRPGQACSACGGTLTLKNLEVVDVCSEVPAVDAAGTVDREPGHAGVVEKG
jgi:DNA-binding HxlR family transcriptional regulator